MIDNSILNILYSHKESSFNKAKNTKSDTKRNEDVFKNFLSQKSQQIKNHKENNPDKESYSTTKVSLSKDSKEKNLEKKAQDNEKVTCLVELVEDENNIEDISEVLQNILNKLMIMINQMDNNSENFDHELSQLIPLINNFILSEANNNSISSDELTSLKSISQLLTVLEDNSIDFKTFKEEINMILKSLNASNEDSILNYEDVDIESEAKTQSIENQNQKNYSENKSANELESNDITEQRIGNAESTSDKKSELFTDDNSSENNSKKDEDNSSEAFNYDSKKYDSTIKNTDNINSLAANESANIKNIVVEDNRTVTPTPMESNQNFNNFKNTVFNQIVEGFKLNLTDDSSEILIKLKPDNLGDVSMKIAIEKGIVIAKFDVDNQIVKQTIESSLEDLRNSLNDKGFQIQELNVSVNKDPKRRHDFYSYKQKNKNTRKTSNINSLPRNNYGNISYIGPESTLDGLSSTINYLG